MKSEFFLVILMCMMVLLLFLLQNLQVVVKFFSIELIESLHLLVAFLQILDIIFHFYFCIGKDLHSFYPQILYLFLKIILCFDSFLSELLLHFDMATKAFVYFPFGKFNVISSLCLCFYLPKLKTVFEFHQAPSVIDLSKRSIGLSSWPQGP